MGMKKKGKPELNFFQRTSIKMQYFLTRISPVAMLVGVLGVWIFMINVLAPADREKWIERDRRVRREQLDKARKEQMREELIDRSLPGGRHAKYKYINQDTGEERLMTAGELYDELHGGAGRPTSSREGGGAQK